MGRALTILIIVVVIIAAAAAALFTDSGSAQNREETTSRGVAAKPANGIANVETVAARNARDRSEETGEKAASSPTAESQPTADLSTASLVFHGIVLDGARKPVNGAEVTAMRLYGPTGSLTTKTSTGADGRFAVGLPDRLGWGWRLEAKATGYSTSYVSEIPAWLSDVDVGVIYLYTSVAARGKVMNRDGSPVANAQVFVMTVPPPVDENADESEESTGNYKPLATTGADGAYSIAQLPQGKITIGVQAAGYADGVRPGVQLASERNNSIDFTLMPEEPLSGHIVDEHASAVPKAQVFAGTYDSKRAFWRKPIDSDATGNFTVHGLDRNRRSLNLRITKLGYTQLWQNGTHLPADEKYTLRKAPQFIVKVEEQGGAPGEKIQSLRFEMRRNNNRWNSWGDIQKSQREVVQPNIWKVTTDIKGTVRAVATTIAGTTGTSADFEIAQNQTDAREVTVTLEPAGTLEGKVVKSDTTPVAGVRVEAINAKNRNTLKVTTTKEDGTFSFAGLSAGTTQLALRSTDWVTQEAKAEIRAGEKTSGIEIVAMKPSAIKGRITVGGAAPVEPVTLAFYSIHNYENYQQWNQIGVASTGADSNYMMSPVPSGRVAIVPKRAVDVDDAALRNFQNEMEHPEWDQEIQKTWQWVVDVPPEGAATLDIDLAAPRYAFVKGTITVNGEPRPGLSVSIYSDRGGDWRSDMSGADGKFSFKMNKSGDYNLQMNGDGFNENRKVSIAEGENREINFDLVSGGIEGSITDPSGQPLALRVKLERKRVKRAENDGSYDWYEAPEQLTKADGSYAFPEVVAGMYRVVVNDYQHRYATIASAGFTVGPKEKYPVPQLRIPLAAPLVVTAKTADGKPVNGNVTVVASPGSDPLAKRSSAWLGRGSSKLQSLRPGPVIIRFQPQGGYTCDPQAVTLPGDGSTTTITFECKKREPAANPGATPGGTPADANGQPGGAANNADVATMLQAFNNNNDNEWEGGWDWDGGDYMDWGGGNVEFSGMDLNDFGGGVQIMSSDGGTFIINK
ncbi:MAG: carboxypeptidase regulatory-like domain-containing protein [Planctomycetes bacterium]|nr:carboxypeptidase regulatory-like domain-containing protein [Planctomycetota bacterium]